MTPYRSALGSPSKDSELYFMMLKKLKQNITLMKRNMMFNHMLRPTITDGQDKYCAICYDTYLIQGQYKGNNKRGGAAEYWLSIG